MVPYAVGSWIDLVHSLYRVLHDSDRRIDLVLNLIEYPGQMVLLVAHLFGRVHEHGQDVPLLSTLQPQLLHVRINRFQPRRHALLILGIKIIKTAVLLHSGLRIWIQHETERHRHTEPGAKARRGLGGELEHLRVLGKENVPAAFALLLVLPVSDRRRIQAAPALYPVVRGLSSPHTKPARLRGWRAIVLLGLLRRQVLECLEMCVGLGLQSSRASCPSPEAHVKPPWFPAFFERVHEVLDDCKALTDSAHHFVDGLQLAHRRDLANGPRPRLICNGTQGAQHHSGKASGARAEARAL
mmetsp:Transcript_24054/g.66912  ORF Transcript_24054/g.66912 Transcript_24054/m.66912 type:complete len:298 (-) Transcript_24054:31-924(-)